MATTLQTLVDRTRNYLRDTPDYDQLSASLAIATAGTNSTFTVPDNTIYRKRWPIEVDYETMMIRSLGGTQSITATRGWRGSTAASHANSAAVLVRPSFYSAEIIDAINGAFYSLYPWVYQPVVDTSLTVLTNQYQYVIPSLPGFTGYPIPAIYKLEILQPGDFTYRSTRRWEVARGTVTAGSPTSVGGVTSTYPIIKFKALPPIGSTIRIHGYGPFGPLASLTDTLDPLFPPQVAYLLHKIAAGNLLMSGEAGRDRSDSGPIDRREEANRAGVSLATGTGVISRAEFELIRNAMPPMPRHIKAVI